jgi:hypothetical protein
MILVPLFDLKFPNEPVATDTELQIGGTDAATDGEPAAGADIAGSPVAELGVRYPARLSPYG